MPIVSIAVQREALPRRGRAYPQLLKSQLDQFALLQAAKEQDKAGSGSIHRGHPGNQKMQGQGGPSCILMDVVQAPVIALNQHILTRVLHDRKTDRKESYQSVLILMVEATAGVRVIVALAASIEDKDCWFLAILKILMILPCNFFGTTSGTNIFLIPKS